jgi:hypothetical protein
MLAEKSHHLRSQVADMYPNCCSFCQHPNPADAKFCNECGNTMALKPCVQCDAVNDPDAACCHVCGKPLVDPPGPAGYEQASSPARSSRTLEDALGVIRSRGFAGGITSTPFSRSPMSSRNARGLPELDPRESIDADPASVRFDGVAFPDAATTPLKAPLPHSPQRGQSHAGTMVRALRPIIVASLMTAVCVGLFRADQHAPRAYPPLAAVPAGPALGTEAGIASLASIHPRDGLRRAEDVGKNALPSLRTTHGEIANSVERKQALASPPPADALGLEAQAPALAVGRQSSTGGSPLTTLASEVPTARIAMPTRNARRATQVASGFPSAPPDPLPRNARASRIPSTDRISAAAASSAYPIPADGCTPSVAALALCRTEAR